MYLTLRTPEDVSNPSTSFKGVYQNSAISVIPACYVNTSVYIKAGYLAVGVTTKQPEIRE